MDLLTNQKSCNRFIVIINESLTNNSNLAHAVYWMAEPENCPVLYLVPVDNSDNLLEISRNMATMKAVTSSNKLKVDVKITKTGQWLEVLKKSLEAGDVIICQQEQTVTVGLLKAVPLNEFISSQLDFPVHTMSGHYHPIQTKSKKWLREFMLTMVFLGILSVFTWLQISLDQAFDHPLAAIHIFITLGIEVGVIWALHKFVYR